MFQQNPFCKLLKIRYPILQGGMVWTSGWKLATAVSKAGGFGLIGSGSMRPDLLREHIQKAKNTGERFGVNVPLFYKYTDEFMKMIVEEKVEVVVTSAGSPKTYTEKLKAEGIIVGHVVSNLKFALKCQEAKVDFIVAEGFEAGGHNGREELTTLVLAQMLRPHIQCPLLMAGGIARGSSMAAMLVMGCDGVQVGTRFAATKESSLHDNFKKAILEAKEDSTKLILKQLAPVRVILNDWAKKADQEERAGASKEKLEEILGKGRSRIGMFEGNVSDGELEIGQIACLINTIPSLEECFQGFLKEFEESLKILKTI